MQNSLAVGGLLLLALSSVSFSSADNVVYNHDCIVGSPPACNHSLANDKSCRGLYSSDIKAYESIDCDYVIYDVKAAEPTNKFIVIHAGQCDVDTEWLGDWAYENTPYNLYGLRPCVGINHITCLFNRSICDALHLSWTVNNGVPGILPSLGLGFNPPALIEYAQDPNNTFLFLHAYDGIPDYPWAQVCNETQPAYVCIWSPDGDDNYDNFDRKFYGDPELGSLGIKDIMESWSNTEYVPCAVEVIDARNSSMTPGFDLGTYFGEKEPLNRIADLPCSGMYPQLQTQGFLFEIQDTISQGLHVAIIKTQENPGDTNARAILDGFAQALELAMGDL